MASENNEIGDIVKKCKILLLDIEGTTTSISFVKDKLFPYAEANVKDFLESQWESDDVKEAVAALRKLAIEDQEKNVEGVVTIPGEDAGKEEQIEGLVKSVQWQMSADRKAGPLKQLQGLIWKQGYDKGDIKGHVYDDVPPALELWRSTEGQKVYIYSSGSVQAQKLLFNLSVAGDLLPHIEGHFDTAIGAKQEPASYVAIAEKIASKPEEILFLTDIVKEAEAARASGLQAALVSREGNAPLPDEATSYPVLHSFEQLTVSNKRKPDPQVEEVPAKVPKTDLEADVKTASEMEVSETTASEVVASTELVAVSENITAVEIATKVAEEPERMEVEEEISVAETATVTEQVEKMAEKDKETPVRVETSIEEVTNSNGAGDAPVCDIEPVIEESVEKTEKNETEKMETEDIETLYNVDEPKENVQEKIDEQSAPVAEETQQSVMTVQDVTNDQTVGSGTEIIEDLVPVVEEPENGEMDELRNVGDVLEKECDEILSKVQDVTNLNNIPVKTMLNSIAEEPLESENGENTNDIVESILDSEMELGDKPCEDIDVNAVLEITDAKADVVEEKSENVQANAVDSNVKVEEKPAENTADTVVSVQEENKINKTTVEFNKDQEKVVMDKNGSAETEAEVKKDEICADKSVIPDDTNGEVQESKPEPVEEKMEATDSVTEPESNVVAENKDSKEVPVEAVDNNTDSTESPANPEDNNTESKESATALGANKMESEETIASPVENKIESEENTAKLVENKMDSEEISAMLVENKMECVENPVMSVENKMESVETPATPVENEMESEETLATPLENKIESQENTATPIDDKMESEDNTVTPVDNKAETKEAGAEPVKNNGEAVESIAEPVENKAETEESIVEPVKNKAEIKQSIVEPVNSKMESADSATTKPSEEQKESEDITVDSVENKPEIKEKIAAQVDTQMESEDMTESDNKTGPEDNKIEPEDSKMEADDNKIESGDHTAKPVDNKMESEVSMPQGSKTEENIAEPEATVLESKVNDNSIDCTDSSEPIVTEAVLKESASKDVQMETEATDNRVNGKTNGEPDATANGDASKEEELNARLSVENGENGKEVNGANGNGESNETEKGQGDNKVETETSDIKVKTVATEEPRPDPIEQPVEA